VTVTDKEAFSKWMDDVDDILARKLDGRDSNDMGRMPWTMWFFLGYTTEEAAKAAIDLWTDKGAPNL
jgi:hypothetical protein